MSADWSSSWIRVSELGNQVLVARLASNPQGLFGGDTRKHGELTLPQPDGYATALQHGCPVPAETGRARKVAVTQ
ncbi:hypothetical protein EFL26_21710 [Nocardioides pocheonensis]|jgi:hypothetical protein|uniref:Uncharacterized protein n=1 Tax=Nocardioides pocheonensis TaxID=661485 RepID=A0A3N0GH26_9ACTN|nr:hypothetical protein EFL26_21710 [Nocardioides pocheonensis]